MKFNCWLLCLLLLGISACSSAPVPSAKRASYKLSAPSDAFLGRYLAGDLSDNPGQTGVLPLGLGIDAFVIRLAIIDAAQTSIDLQYYIYRDDDTGRLLSWHLIDAANRGVRVRILLDDLTTKTLDDSLVVMASHPNIEIRLFNPSYERSLRSLAMITGFSRLNYRMHNKSITADNLITVVGGRNIGNEYFSKNSDVDFGDLDLLAVGDAVEQVSDQFDLYWNANVVEPIENLVAKPTDSMLQAAQASMTRHRAEFADNEYLKRLALSELVKPLTENDIGWYWGQAEVVYDPPEKANSDQRESWLLSDLSRFLARAQRQVLIVSPYFVPTYSGSQALIKAANAGIDVTIITNSLAATDVLAVHAGYKAYRQRLLENGVRLYEAKVDIKRRPSAWQGSSRSSLHAKTFILDGQAVFVGSFNFDPRSAWINTEMGLIVEQPQLADELLQVIRGALKKSCYRLALDEQGLIWIDDVDGKIYHADPDASFWRRFLADLIGLFPIESQL